MIQANGALAPLFQWESYAGLRSLRKPVEMLWLPNGKHVLAKPLELLASQQGAVDWFRFWLKGEEDSDSAKAEQYARCRELRRLQENGGASDSSGGGRSAD